MFIFLAKPQQKLFSKLVFILVLSSFLGTSVGVNYAHAAMALPEPTQLLNLSATYSFPILKGLKLNPANPLQIEFIIDTASKDTVDKEEADKLIRYFLAGLTIPENDLWVNLSVYEKDRVITNEAIHTDVGRDMLAQDYILKQLVSSLTHPENSIGRNYWQSVYSQIGKLAGTDNLPINTFNKIWITPDKSEVYEYKNTVVINQATLKAMLEQDFLALQKGTKDEKAGQTNKVASDVMREVVVPKITDDINSGKNFATLRQIYYSLILAKWFKDKFKESFYKHYINQKNIKGIDINDPQAKEKIYSLYTQAFKKGIYNYIKKEQDPSTKHQVRRRYFSGGIESLIANSPLVTKLAISSSLDSVAHNGKLVNVSTLAVAGVGASPLPTAPAARQRGPDDIAKDIPADPGKLKVEIPVSLEVREGKKVISIWIANGSDSGSVANFSIRNGESSAAGITPWSFLSADKNTPGKIILRSHSGTTTLTYDTNTYTLTVETSKPSGNDWLAAYQRAASPLQRMAPAEADAVGKIATGAILGFAETHRDTVNVIDRGTVKTPTWWRANASSLHGSAEFQLEELISRVLQLPVDDYTPQIGKTGYLSIAVSREQTRRGEFDLRVSIDSSDGSLGRSFSSKPYITFLLALYQNGRVKNIGVEAISSPVGEGDEKQTSPARYSLTINKNKPAQLLEALRAKGVDLLRPELVADAANALIPGTGSKPVGLDIAWSKRVDAIVDGEEKKVSLSLTHTVGAYNLVARVTLFPTETREIEPIDDFYVASSPSPAITNSSSLREIKDELRAIKTAMRETQGANYDAAGEMVKLLPPIATSRVKKVFISEYALRFALRQDQKDDLLEQTFGRDLIMSLHRGGWTIGVPRHWSDAVPTAFLESNPVTWVMVLGLDQFKEPMFKWLKRLTMNGVVNSDKKDTVTLAAMIIKKLWDSTNASPVNTTSRIDKTDLPSRKKLFENIGAAIQEQIAASGEMIRADGRYSESAIDTIKEAAVSQIVAGIGASSKEEFLANRPDLFKFGIAAALSVGLPRFAFLASGDRITVLESAQDYDTQSLAAYFGQPVDVVLPRGIMPEKALTAGIEMVRRMASEDMATIESEYYKGVPSSFVIMPLGKITALSAGEYATQHRPLVLEFQSRLSLIRRLYQDEARILANAAIFKTVGTTTYQKQLADAIRAIDVWQPSREAREDLASVSSASPVDDIHNLGTGDRATPREILFTTGVAAKRGRSFSGADARRGSPSIVRINEFKYFARFLSVLAEAINALGVGKDLTFARLVSFIRLHRSSFIITDSRDVVYNDEGFRMNSLSDLEPFRQALEARGWSIAVEGELWRINAIGKRVSRSASAGQGKSGIRQLTAGKTKTAAGAASPVHYRDVDVEKDGKTLGVESAIAGEAAKTIYQGLSNAMRYGAWIMRLADLPQEIDVLRIGDNRTLIINRNNLEVLATSKESREVRIDSLSAQYLDAGNWREIVLIVENSRDNQVEYKNVDAQRDGKTLYVEKDISAAAAKTIYQGLSNAMRYGAWIMRLADLPQEIDVLRIGGNRTLIINRNNLEALTAGKESREVRIDSLDAQHLTAGNWQGIINIVEETSAASPAQKLTVLDAIRINDAIHTFLGIIGANGATSVFGPNQEFEEALAGRYEIAVTLKGGVSTFDLVKAQEYIAQLKGEYPGSEITLDASGTQPKFVITAAGSNAGAEKPVEVTSSPGGIKMSGIQVASSPTSQKMEFAAVGPDFFDRLTFRIVSMKQIISLAQFASLP